MVCDLPQGYQSDHPAHCPHLHATPQTLASPEALCTHLDAFMESSAQPPCLRGGFGGGACGRQVKRTVIQFVPPNTTGHLKEVSPLKHFPDKNTKIAGGGGTRL